MHIIDGLNLGFQPAYDNLAEWSKALDLGSSPKGREFKSHSCHSVLLFLFYLWLLAFGTLDPVAPLFSLIKFSLGTPREQRVCRHCSMQAVEDEQHFLFDCPIYSIIRGQHFSLFGPNYQQRDIRLFFEQNSHQLGFVAHHIHLCFQARISDESLLAPHPRL